MSLQITWRLVETDYVSVGLGQSQRVFIFHKFSDVPATGPYLTSEVLVGKQLESLKGVFCGCSFVSKGHDLQLCMTYSFALFGPHNLKLTFENQETSHKDWAFWFSKNPAIAGITGPEV